MKELTLPAVLDSLPAITAFMEEQLVGSGCPVRAQAHLCIAVDELFSNIAHYAYPGGAGDATLRLELQPGRITLTFLDSGVPHDPTACAAPDVHAPLNARREGGLGIYLVRKTMDEMTYRRCGDRNVVTIVKTW